MSRLFHFLRRLFRRGRPTLTAEEIADALVAKIVPHVAAKFEELDREHKARLDAVDARCQLSLKQVELLVELGALVVKERNALWKARN